MPIIFACEFVIKGKVCILESGEIRHRLPIVDSIKNDCRLRYMRAFAIRVDGRQWSCDRRHTCCFFGLATKQTTRTQVHVTDDKWSVSRIGMYRRYRHVMSP